MITKIRQTKSEKIARDLRKSIWEGDFPDGRLPSKMDLIRHFDVSQQTIDTALKCLREEGLIRGVRGTGIFVNNTIQDVSNLTRRLVLILTLKNSILEESFDALRAEALRRSLFPIHLYIPPPNQPMTLQEKASMTQLLRSPICGVIYRGESYWRHPYLDQWKNLRSVGIVHFDSGSDAPGSVVEVDFEAGGYKLAKHMYAQGAERLLVYHGLIREDVPQSAAYWQRHPAHLFLAGANRAAKESGKAEIQLLFMHNWESAAGGDISWQTEWQNIRKTGCDGILCGSDDLAMQLLLQARLHQVKVPDQLLISGCYDTQKENIFENSPVTTLNICPEEMSRLAFDCLEQGGIHHFKVRPELIIRKSTQKNRKHLCSIINQ